MGESSAIGSRIRSRIPSGMSQRQLAEEAGMTADALSRSLNGQRGLASFEVAQIASVLGADTHWLITGTPDPFQVKVAARHQWDAASRSRTNSGRDDDQAVLVTVVDVYRAAFPHGPAASGEVPRDPAELRRVLGEGFVFDFVGNVERELGVDVIRIPGLTTDYSLRLGDRGIIVLASMASWFRSNWSLAHELGHLALDHHNGSPSRDRNVGRKEKSANDYASKLLIPDASLARLTSAADTREVASVVWELGVSTESLRYRLEAARVTPPTLVIDALNEVTPRLLRANRNAISDGGYAGDPLAAREQASSARRFPLSLLEALREQTAIGAASPMQLAWVLDVPVDDLDFPEPDDDAEAIRYAAMIDDQAGRTDWQVLIARH